MKNREKLRRRAVLVLGAWIYALLYALCSQIDESGTVCLTQAAVRFSLVLPAALGVLWVLFRCVLPRCEVSRREAEPKKHFMTVGVFAFLVCCYGAMFLIQYPGSFMYDTQRQVFQIARGEYEMFHPLLHTLLIRACLAMYDVLGSFEKCAALYSVVQLVLIALCFSLVCGSVSRVFSGRAARVTALFFGLYPSHAALAGNCTKDGLFSAFFALFLALCMEDVLLGGMPARRRVLQLAAGVLACLLRNNMVYALAVWCVLLLVRGRKYLRLVMAGALSVALGLSVNAGLQRATNAADGSRIEMLSVPIQQLSRAMLYAPQCFEQAEQELVSLVFVDAKYHLTDRLYEHYEPTLADPVKNYLDEDVVLENFPALVQMWANVGMKCPGVYLDAFLNLALPSLYPYSEYRVAQPYIETGLQPGVVTAPFGYPPMTQPGRFAGIRDWLYEHIYSTGADDLPVIRLLFNTGFVFWVLLLLTLYALHCGDGRRFAVLLLVVLLWGTYLLGPVMQGRYLYPFICVLPLFFLRAKNI